MRISKSSTSELQKLNFTTIRDLEDYIILTTPLDCSVEIKNKHVHIRRKEK